jgi:hypothetical protein
MLTYPKEDSFGIARVVMVSGGLGSFEAARRVLERYGKKNVHLWFADTRMEDEDLYRFLNDVESNLGVKIHRFAEGRTPWEVFKDERFLGNSRIDPCSKILKRQFLREKLISTFGYLNAIVYLGLDWTEPHRVSRASEYWEKDGIKVDFPLCWEPFLFPQDYFEIARGYGIEPPRLYQYGFPHNNCGGACVKAGIKQWAHLWKTFPDRYLWNETQEEQLRHYLGKNISILVDRHGGERRPMTLRELRKRLEEDDVQRKFNEPSLYDRLPDDGWVCSCFANAYDG